MRTKTINVISTLINGRKNYVAGISTSGVIKNSVNFTTDFKGMAKEFPTLQEANDFIPTINNPHNRIFTAHTETIEFTSVKDRHAYEKIS